ncbi:coiled-coil domain-containing protein [Terrilactibacillus laevilacticus]|uniref:Coiled-coil domain-containing protein n=1 Tax=Terrilactibacillus laevilacticus TaxID=1380157 RepID=A0ABW5PQC8_9BACI|nr:C40 family peptidase [Terrilactibacillus laevilacticus]
MKKKLTVTLALSLSVTCGSLVPSFTYAKESLSTINDKTQAQLSLKDQLSSQKAKLQADIDGMNKKVLDLTGQVSNTQVKISKIEDEVSTLQSQIEDIQDRIEKRKGLLKDRLESIYVNGGSVGFLDVILGSKSIGDFLERTFAVNEITQQDQNIIDDQKKDEKDLSTKKEQVQTKLALSEKKVEQLRGMLQEVQALQTQKQVAMKALNSKQENVEKNIAQLKQVALDIKSAQTAEEKTNNSQPTLTKLSAPVEKHTAVSTDLTNSTDSTDSTNSTDSTDKTPSAKPKKMKAAAPSHKSNNLTMSASVSSGGISGILSWGRQYFGRSTYVFGAGRSASDIANGRFDCSGFVSAAFRANGISIPSSTSALSGVGQRVSPSDMKPGDLVFFDTYKKDGHVGIYLGGGSFIGSQSSTGVAVVSMNNSYWKSHFSGHVQRVLH